MSIRTTKPKAGDKYFIRQVRGGYSTCIQGKPTDPNCDVLANCVGYACGAYNEENDLGYEKYHLNCNAENFIERAIASGLSVVDYPVPGGIMVWQKGTLASSDGAGHVAICTWSNDAKNPTQVKTAESGYGSSAFWTATRNKGNGNWGASGSYKWRGCIVNPTIGLPVAPEPTPVPTPEPEPTPEPAKQKFEIGASVIITGGLYKTANSSKPAGSVSAKKTYITRYAAGTKHPYNTTGDLGWMDESSIQPYTETEYITYTVRAGDNLSSIAYKYGTTWQKIYADNKDVIGRNPNIIRPGQVLVIK